MHIQTKLFNSITLLRLDVKRRQKSNNTDLHKYFLKQANILLSVAVLQTKPQNWLQLGHPTLSLRRFDDFRFKNAKKKWKLCMNRDSLKYFKAFSKNKHLLRSHLVQWKFNMSHSKENRALRKKLWIIKHKHQDHVLRHYKILKTFISFFYR